VKLQINKFNYISNLNEPIIAHKHLKSLNTLEFLEFTLLVHSCYCFIDNIPTSSRENYRCGTFIILFCLFQHSYECATYDTVCFIDDIHMMYLYVPSIYNYELIHESNESNYI
jgi:hypothetical protein